MQPVKKGYWVEMVRCSERIGSSGDNDSSGGGGKDRELSARAIYLRKAKMFNMEKVEPMLNLN